MLVTSRVAGVLEGQRDEFHRAAVRSLEQQERYGDAMERLSELSRSAIDERLRADEWPGARPTGDLDERGLIVPFTEQWESARAARRWALDRLRGITTAAVDGSQIAASKEFGVPVSLVQVAWFENYHDPQRPYLKDVRNEVILAGDLDDELEPYGFAESNLNRRRFAMEMQVAGERVEALSDRTSSVVLVDGSFVLSFAGRMAPEARQAYLQSLFALMDRSERMRVPVVGYIDLSFASDLLTMIRTVFDVPQGSVFDALVLGNRMSPFDRTAAFQCARGDVLPHYRTPRHDYSQDVSFLYLKTGRDGLPARLDFPSWIIDAGLLNQVVDVVRAEIVVGSGYPYALETADAAAVLTIEDRMAFYRMFHNFASAAGVETMLPAKTTSKAHRR